MFVLFDVQKLKSSYKLWSATAIPVYKPNFIVVLRFAA